MSNINANCINMEEERDEAKKILEELNSNFSVQTSACSKNCRYAAFAIMAVAWGLLKDNKDSRSEIVLTIVLTIGVLYMIIETLRYYVSAKLSRELHMLRCKELIDNRSANILRNKYSDKAFIVLKYEIILCIIMGLIFSVYVFLYWI